MYQLLLKILACMVAVVALAVIGGEAFTQPTRKPPMPFDVVGFQGVLPIPKAEFTPVIDEAKQKLESHFQNLAELELWRKITAVVALVGSAALAFVAGFYGHTAATDANGGAELKSISGARISSARTIRLIGILVAITTTINLTKQYIGSERTEALRRADKLHATIMESSDLLFDSDSTERVARSALIRLELAVNEP